MGRLPRSRGCPLNRGSNVSLHWPANSRRFSSLIAAEGRFARRISATQRQKSHTDDAKSVRNPVRRSSLIVLVIVYE